MASNEMLLFQKALWEASCNVYERELAECGDMDAKCSRRHYAKMRKILGVAILPATTPAIRIKRRVIAALIAAALLLTGCTAYAYREEIREFIETVFENYIRVTYHDGEESPTEATLGEYYTLGYVPEGYKLLKSFEEPQKVKREWSNSVGDYIAFEQYHVDSSLFVVDNDLENWNIVKIGNREIYYRFSGSHYYLWNDGVYAYQLATSILWEEQNLNLIIENIRIKE